MIVFCLAVCTVALSVISVTMLARANDLRCRPGIRWNVRLAGFIVSGASPVGVIGYGWAHEWMAALVYLTAFLVGVMLVFVTTPYLPPWWRWISGKDEPNDTN